MTTGTGLRDDRELALDPARPAGLRARHRDDTRRAILQAFSDLLDEGNPVTVSIPSVAARAGVSVRTLYRYFANKDELMEAGSRWFDEAARGAIGGEVTADNRGEFLRRLWQDFATNMPAVRGQHASQAGRELRQYRLALSRAIVDRAVPDTVQGSTRADVVDLVVALSSSSMFLELVDRMGHDPERAAALADHLIDLVITDAQGAPR
jgi:AcrR family transcriptional regulator